MITIENRNIGHCEDMEIGFYHYFSRTNRKCQFRCQARKTVLVHTAYQFHRTCHIETSHIQRS